MKVVSCCENCNLKSHEKTRKRILCIWKRKMFKIEYINNTKTRSSLYWRAYWNLSLEVNYQMTWTLQYKVLVSYLHLWRRKGAVSKTEKHVGACNMFPQNILIPLVIIKYWRFDHKYYIWGALNFCFGLKP